MLKTYIIYQYYHCHVTQPLLLEQLREWEIDISAGQLNQIIVEGKEKYHQEKAELLKVLEKPELPLHNNASEQDIREFVKKRKISGSTRSEEGRRCRDTFASLKKTVTKIGGFVLELSDR